MTRHGADMAERLAHVAIGPAALARVAGMRLQRKCACGTHTSHGGECADCKGKLQRLAGSQARAGLSPPNVEAVLNQPGQPLQGSAMAFFESRFGHDFSRVRVHTDRDSADSARAVAARAYTVGEHIVFGSGQYASDSSAGRLLLAHELTHVLQQRPGLKRAPPRDHAAAAMAVSHASQGTLRRQPYPGAIGRCHAMGVPCPAPYFHHGSVGRLVDCYAAATANLPLAISPGVCVYHFVDGKVCACVLVGSKTSAMCTFTFCDQAGPGSADIDPRGVADRAVAMAAEQRGYAGGAEPASDPVSGATAPIAQAQLEIGAVDDPLESEADRVAHRIVDAAEPPRALAPARAAPPMRTALPVSPPDERMPRSGSARLLRRIPDLTGDHGDDEHRSRGGTLSYRDATELLACTRIMGEANMDYCREQVLGEKPPAPPRFTQVPGITSPQPRGTQVRADGSTNFPVGNVDTTFKPDAQSTDPKLAGGAETRIELSWGGIHYETNPAGRIKSFTGPGTAQASIQTTYGSGATPAGSSGYGRGTTVADKAAGNTSLGFHEGNHGIDFMNYLAAHRFPDFTGRIGMTEPAFKAAIATYTAAAKAYYASIKDYSVQQTDCVGYSIDSSNAAAASIHGGSATVAVCRQVRP